MNKREFLRIKVFTSVGIPSSATSFFLLKIIEHVNLSQARGFPKKVIIYLLIDFLTLTFPSTTITLTNIQTSAFVASLLS